MRPLELSISGLNSFRRPVKIDFDALLKDGLFGIFGPTGSGKSSILDAITLALYGKVRRAPGGTQGIINMGEQRCSVSFSFSIGDSGSRRSCTVERLLARNSKTGGVETKKVRLAVYRAGVLEKVGEKANELKDMVQDIVGINIDDFLRAVVLPQGAFADFLTLEPAPRRAVLQRLFGLYQLGDQLNHVLQQHAQVLQDAHAHVMGRLQDLRAYDDEALALCREALGEAERAHGESRAALEACERRYGEAAALFALIEEYRTLMRDEDGRRAQANDLLACHARIELAERSSAVGPALAAVTASHARFAEADGRYNDAVRNNDAIAQRLADARSRFVKAESEHTARYDSLCDELNELKQMKKDDDDLRDRRERLGVVDRDLASVGDTLAARTTLRDAAAVEVAGLESAIAGLDTRIQTMSVSADDRRILNELQLSIQTQKNLQRELEQCAGDRDLIERELAAAAKAVDAAIEEARARDGEAVAAREQLAAAKAQLASHTKQLDDLLAEHGRLKDPLARIEPHESNLATIEVELAEQRVKLADAQGALAENRRLLDEAQSRVHAAAADLRAAAHRRDEAQRLLALASLADQLQDGVPCPLCGALEHLAPFHEGSEIVGRLELVGSELTGAEDRMREAEEHRRRIEQSVTKSESTLEHLAADIDERLKRQALSVAAIAGELGRVGSEKPAATVVELRARIESVTTEGRTVRQRIGELNAEIELRDTRAAAAEAARGTAGEQRARAEADLHARRNRMAEQDQTLGNLRSRLAEESRRFAEQSNGRSFEAAELALGRMQESDRMIEELRGTMRDRQHELQTNRAGLAGIERDMQEIASRRDGLDGERRTLAADITAMAERLSRGLKGLLIDSERNQSLERVIERRERVRDDIRREYDEARAGNDAANAEAHVARERIDTSWNARCREEKERDEADRLCADLLAQHGFATITEAEAGAIAPADLRALREEARRIEEGLERVRHRIAELDGRIAGRAIGSEEMVALEEEMRIAKLADEEATRGLGAAQEKLRECGEKNIEWRNVSQQDALAVEGKSVADQLAKYLRGNAFIDFLANERLAEICRRATMQLGLLTTGRFELDSRPKEGFIIRDNGNGGGERSPTSLSGGETFLVSLSLAIALSDTIQLGHAPLEFFFLDEGFGTLDSDLLETVMNTLDRLRSDHRAIGVISHVAQLRERISRRLIVTPASELEGSTVRYESV